MRRSTVFGSDMMRWVRRETSAKFAVEGAALEEMIELHFLQTARSTEALLVARGDVT